MVTTEAVYAVTAARITLKTKLEKTYCVISIFSKKVSIELGEALSIVFNDTDIDAAVTSAVIFKFHNEGQT